LCGCAARQASPVHGMAASAQASIALLEAALFSKARARACARTHIHTMRFRVQSPTSLLLPLSHTLAVCIGRR
jgi:hypothetical protein